LTFDHKNVKKKNVLKNEYFVKLQVYFKEFCPEKEKINSDKHTGVLG